jgi:hypothetical protein
MAAALSFDKQLVLLDCVCDILAATPGRLPDFNQRGEAPKYGRSDGARRSRPHKTWANP